MRDHFFKALIELADANKDVVFITADLGFMVINEFCSKHPKKFINVGVAEQNMIGVAAGLALEGKKVFVYSIANFPTLRCYEQIRNDVCYHNLDVTIVSIGAGFAYGALGMSHHATEDIAAMRALPNMTVLSPSDPNETYAIMKYLGHEHGPSYLRLGRAGEKNIHKKPVSFDINSVYKLNSGTDLAILATGAILAVADEVVNILRNRSISVDLYSIPVVKPLNKQVIKQIVTSHKIVFSLEEHNLIGGLGTAVAEVIAGDTSAENKPKFSRLAINDTYSSVVGQQDYLREYYGISSKKIAKVVLEFVKNAESILE